MAKEIFQKYDVEFRKKVFVPTPETDDEAVNLGKLNDEFENKAEIDGSNTNGGTWKIDRIQSTSTGDVFNTPTISVLHDLGIPTNTVISNTYAIVLGELGSKPIVISESSYDNFIYKAGEAYNYPAHINKGNYIVESKNRYRSTFIDTLSETDGSVGKVIIEPFNGIEHQYYEVEITDTLTELEILLVKPTKDEVSGNKIYRNAHGQKVTILITDESTPITFINTFLNRTPTMNNKGVYTFYFDTESGKWDFGGYQQF